MRHNKESGFFFLIIFRSIIPSIFLTLILPAGSFAARFSGIVVDDKGQPLGNAVVRLQATSLYTSTDQSGRFQLVADESANSKYLTAWKHGFYNGGTRISAKIRDYRIKLVPVPQGDNREYKWMQPLRNQEIRASKGRVKEKTCQDCHTKDFMELWKNSSHARSAVNPFFLSFFNGTDIGGNNAAGLGYKLDFPNSNGNCATCHVPAMALNNPFNSDPNKAQGVEKQGVFCDLCHKITDVAIDKTGGHPGVLSMKFQRPPERKQLFFGPYDDVFPGPDTYDLFYKDSRYCASCHNGRFWDVLVYPEFQEWAESSYAKKNIHCQDCHMKPDNKTTGFVQKKKGGLQRDSSTIYSHKFSGISDDAFMKDAIAMDMRANLQGDVLAVTITVKNLKAGHHYPTGNPMRNMILLVDAADEKGRQLSMIKGERVPEWGGTGDAREGNYSGMPGKGFAKILKDMMPYPDRIKRDFQHAYPAPHWRPTVIDSDNRIPEGGSDISVYEFHLPADVQGRIDVTSRLIFRKAFKGWLDAKGAKADDLQIARQSVMLMREGGK